MRSVEVDTATLMWRFAIEFEFPDPRLYSAVLQQASLTVFVAGSLALDFTVGAGADLALDFTVGSGADIAVDFTGTASSGLQTITNLGAVDTYPIFVFSPATGISSFSVTNQTTGQVLTINQSVVAGQTLIADMQAAATGMSSGVASLPISIGGTSVYGSWQAPRTPFRLVPGPNVLRFDVATGDPSATALATAPSAYV
jgi:Phage tail protein